MSTDELRGETWTHELTSCSPPSDTGPVHPLGVRRMIMGQRGFAGEDWPDRASF